MDISESIKKIREFKNIKRSYMASKPGIGVSAYGNLERGESNINAERLAKIAAILEVPVKCLNKLSQDDGAHYILNSDNNSLAGNNIHNGTIDPGMEKLMQLHQQTLQVLEKTLLILEQVTASTTQ